MRGGLMVCGTASDVGKTVVVTGLCRMLHRWGVNVAPFKAQNMSLNSWVTIDGGEIGRAQAVQALAAGIEPDVAMNPVLLKPTGPLTSQVVVRGRPEADLDFREYQAQHERMWVVVRDSLAELRSRHDVVVAEGAGGAAEINLAPRDVVNMRVAEEAGFSAVIVGDIERGGVFAALYGTTALLPEPQRHLVRGFIINKFRGEPDLLGDGPAQLEQLSHVPTLGVLPWQSGFGIDEEDSLGLPGVASAARIGCDALDVALIALPHTSNFTDLDPLGGEPGVSVRIVEHPGRLADPDLIIIPGTKATVADLEWLHESGLFGALRARSRSGSTLLGVCGGYQMLGRRILDRVESRRGAVAGLDLLDVETNFEEEKITRRRCGHSLLGQAMPVSGYEIHHGRMQPGAHDDAWFRLDDAYGCEDEGIVASGDASVYGTSLHGLFEEDSFRRSFLSGVAERRGKRFEVSGFSFRTAREARFDALADLIEDHVDIDALLAIIDPT